MGLFGRCEADLPFDLRSSNQTFPRRYEVYKQREPTTEKEERGTSADHVKKKKKTLISCEGERQACISDELDITGEQQRTRKRRRAAIRLLVPLPLQRSIDRPDRRIAYRDADIVLWVTVCQTATNELISIFEQTYRFVVCACVRY